MYLCHTVVVIARSGNLNFCDLVAIIIYSNYISSWLTLSLFQLWELN